MPTPREPRTYLAFLRGPVATKTFAYGTEDEHRAGVQHHRGLSFPAPSDGSDDKFGIQGESGFTLEIADEGDADWFLLQEDESLLILEDGSGKIILEY